MPSYRALCEVVHVLAGMPQLLATSENEGPFLLQDQRFVLLPLVQLRAVLH